MLLWLLVGLFARAAVPARLFAIYVTAQASGSFLLTAVFAAIALPRFGVAGAYGLLAAIDALLLAVVAGIPGRHAPLAAGETSRRGLPALGAAALLGVLLNLAAITALWVYLAPLGQQAGQSELSLRTIWMFTPPFHLPFLIEADPSRRVALFVGAAQLLGVACGPLLASLSITDRSVAGARIVSMGCFVAAGAIAAVVRADARRPDAAGRSSSG